MRVLLMVVGLMLLLPAASATGRLAVGPVSLAVENGHDDACLEDVSGLCLAELRGGSIGETELDASQRVARLVVAYDAAAIDRLLPIPLLPGGEIGVDAADLSVEHPLLVLATALVGTRGVETPWGEVGAGLSPQGVRLSYLGVDEARAAPEPHRQDYNYTDNSVRYRELGPFNRAGGPVRSDDILVAPADACLMVEGTPCSTATAAFVELPNATPSVVAGQELHEAAVSGDPNATLFAAGALHARAAAAHPASPPRTLPRSPVLAVGTPAGGGPPPSDGPEPAELAPRERSPRGGSTPPGNLSLAASATASAPGTVDLPLAPLAASLAIATMLAALYSRFRSRSEALAHEARQRMLGLVQGGPRTVAELAQALGVDRSTAQYHARVLHRAGVVALRKGERHVYVTLPGQPLPEKPVVTIGAPARIVELLRAAGGVLPRASLQEKAPELPPRTRNHALRELVERGVVERKFAGNEEVVALVTAG